MPTSKKPAKKPPKTTKPRTGKPRVHRKSTVLAQAAPEAIAVAAYFRAERRAFAPGGELDDWLAAEREMIGTVRQPESRDPLPAPGE